jgi:hypothetical protein
VSALESTGHPIANTLVRHGGRQRATPIPAEPLFDDHPLHSWHECDSLIDCGLVTRDKNGGHSVRRSSEREERDFSVLDSVDRVAVPRWLDRVLKECT